MSSKGKQAFVKTLAQENKEHYSSPNGRGTLRSFRLAFDHSWTYLSELVQNALDAHARSIALRFAEDGRSFVFQHDGGRLRRRDVKALSTVYRSAKGASSTGFMGVGFKSVFGRFREVCVSGWGWRFRYEIDETVGELGERHPNLLGAVMPIWDETITIPDSGFTTRFEMRQLLDHSPLPKEDLERLVPEVDGDHTPIAILAASGLQRFEVNGKVWKLHVREESDGTREVIATAGSERKNWRLFACEFKPSEVALARFLEHREIQPSEDEREQVYAEVSRPRQVLGVLPLDGEGRPAPPKKGRMYATLPTDVFLPLRIHINADWLLDISRGSLKDIEENQWQRETADRIADILASVVDWSARSFSDPATAQSAFSILAPPSRDPTGLEAVLADRQWLLRLHHLLEDAPVVPVWASPRAMTFARAPDVVVPPSELAEAFRRWPDLNPAVLLGGSVLMAHVLGAGGRSLLESAGLLRSMAPEDLAQRWPVGLQNWWSRTSLEKKERRAHIFHLWAAVARLVSHDEWKEAGLACIRTNSGEWVPTSEAAYFNEPFPSAREPGGGEVLRFIQPFIKDGQRLSDGWFAALEDLARQEKGHIRPLSLAKDWIEKNVQKVNLRTVVDEAVEREQTSRTPDWSTLVPLAHWAKHRRRPDVVRRVLVGPQEETKSVSTEEALLAEPYVETLQGRRSLFPETDVVSSLYLGRDLPREDPREWRLFFEKAGARGKLEVIPLEPERAWQNERERVATFLGLGVEQIGTSNVSGYRLLDFDLLRRAKCSRGATAVAGGCSLA